MEGLVFELGVAFHIFNVFGWGFNNYRRLTNLNYLFQVLALMFFTGNLVI